MGFPSPSQVPPIRNRRSPDRPPRHLGLLFIPFIFAEIMVASRARQTTHKTSGIKKRPPRIRNVPFRQGLPTYAEAVGRSGRKLSGADYPYWYFSWGSREWARRWTATLNFHGTLGRMRRKSQYFRYSPIVGLASCRPSNVDCGILQPRLLR